MFSIFVPAYNEERDLEKNVKEIINALEGIDFELLIVDDVSSDGTRNIGTRLAGEDARVRYLRYDGEKPTRRENLSQSFKKAEGEIIGFIDADLSASPKYFPNMIKKLTEYDIVIGSRYLPQSQIERKLSRLIISRIYNSFLRIYFNTRITDSQCGLKVFKRDVILKLVDEAGYDHKLTRGFSWDAEILIRACKHGYRIAEIPVKWIRSDRTSVRKMRDAQMIPYLLGLKFRL